MSDDTADRPDELIGRARSGDRQALGDLFAHYHAYLRLVIGSSMGPALRRELDVSDVLQETLLVAASRFGNFQGGDERELVAWLRALATRKLIDLARRSKRLKRAPTGQLSIDEPLARWGGSLSDQLAGDLTSPSQGAAKREMAVRLASALAQIDPEEAQVIWLHHVDGLSFEAIGERIGVGRNGIRGIWARGLRSLRHNLPPKGSSISGG